MLRLSSGYRGLLAVSVLMAAFRLGSCSEEGFFGYLTSSDGETWWSLYIVLILAFLVFGFLIYYQLIFGQEVTEGVLNEMAVLYVEHQCSYNSLANAFHRMMKETSEVVHPDEVTGIGFYFDDIGSIKNKQLARASIGVILRSEEEYARAREFVSRSHRYKIARIPEVDLTHSVTSIVQLHPFPQLHLLLLDGVLLEQVCEKVAEDGRPAEQRQRLRNRDL